MAVIRLYEPVVPPIVPHVSLGLATISDDLWAQISGTYPYWDQAKRDEFRLMGHKPLDAPIGPCDGEGTKLASETFPIIKVQVIRVWGPRGETQNWMAIIPDPVHRTLVLSNEYVWRD